MKNPSRVLLVLGALAVTTAALTSGCLFSARARARPVDVYYSTSSEVYVDEPMPAPRVEVVTVAPRATGMIWVGGHWQWGGGRYVWASGRWARPSRPGYVWVGPRYQTRRNRHVYLSGYWAPPSVRVYGNVHTRSPHRSGRGYYHQGPPARRHGPTY